MDTAEVKKWWNKATKKEITDEEYNKLSDEEKGKCVPAREKKPKYKKQDSQWYVVSPEITKAVANLAFNVFPGTKETITFKHEVEDTVNNKYTILRQAPDSTPGIMGIRYVPTYGRSESPTSALNVASRALYSWVRHQNSGRTNYEAPDLMIYIAAMDQVYLALTECCRAYVAARTYTYENRYIPNGLLQAMGITDASDLRKNLANYRYRMNLLIAKTSALCVPKAFNIFKRHAYIAANVFTDSDSLRGQYYIYVAKSYLKYNATGSKDGGMLEAVRAIPNSSSKVTLGSKLDIVEGMLDSILADEDMNIMSGDILKAYGRENLFQLKEVAEEDTLSFVFNEDVLQQIENSSSYKGICLPDSLPANYNIKQKPADESMSGDAWLYTVEPYNNGSTAVQDATYKGLTVDLTYFNSHLKDGATPEQVLEWVRDQNIFGYYDTELVVGYQMHFVDYTSNSTPGWNMISIGSIGGSGAGTPYQFSGGTTLARTILELFDWHPIVYVFDVKNSTSGGVTTSTFNYIGHFGDLKVYTLVDASFSARIHDACIMGALNTLYSGEKFGNK